MRRLGLAIAAGMLLAAADFVLIAASFLYRPEPGEWMILGGLATFAAAVALGQRWLVFVVQNMVSVLAIVRLAQSRDAPDLRDVIFVVVIVVVGNALAWCVARAIRRSNRENARPAGTAVPGDDA